MSAALRERCARVIDGGVEVLQAEDDAFPLTQGGHPRQGPLGGEPHRSGDALHRLDRETHAVEAGAVQVEPGDAEPGGDGDRLLGRGQQLIGAIGVGEIAADVAGHRGKRRATPTKCVDVMLGPVPDLDLEAQFVDAADPVEHR